ncbi:hypothetical protein [Gimesia aquarii]|uniref:DUF8091 domain-containing protein n=1 Tax=Gimesia aquarii TaxID=2527964 RepID=A0A517W2W9_9PLAN|nr:hypothetical protein [Gimesia aquarii]QDT99604.1 hypothetical protein V144x_51160 [Gimesia aquarii]
METSLHRQLKSYYAPNADCEEITLGAYRIDAVDGDRLIEIQHGSLGAIRDKVKCLLEEYDVHVVKPIAVRKYLIKRQKKDGKTLSARFSPRRGSVFDLFDDLVHFTNVFPHPRLTLEVALTIQEEHRTARKPRRWKGKDYRVQDRVLRSVEEQIEFKTAADLLDLIPGKLPSPFHTKDLATAAGVQRWLAQKMAYCLRNTGAIELVGKEKNALLYEIADENQAAA